MTNEMKLLLAICDALRLDVKTIVDTKERKEKKSEAMRHNKGFGFPCTGRRLKTLNHTDKLDIDNEGLYTSYLIDPDISYKVSMRRGG